MGDWTTQITLMGLAFLSARRMATDAARTIKFKMNSGRWTGFVEICSGYSLPSAVKQDERAGTSPPIGRGPLLRLGQGTGQTVRSIKPSSLIIFVISLSVVMAVVTNLRIAGYLALETQLVVACVAFGLNFVAATAGLWTRFRPAWVAYLILSVVSVLLLSSMPITAAWILTKLAVRHAIA